MQDLATGDERLVSNFNAAWTDGIIWPDIEHLVVGSGQGVEIEGWVLKPRHVDPPYRTILYIHGGPHAGFGQVYSEDFQELAGAGYAVAFANPRGSLGYGDSFTKAIVGRWGFPGGIL